MIQLVSCLSEETGIPSAELVRSFGMHLFGRFHTMFPKYFEDVSSSFDFLQRIDHYIHVEVGKLYPDAELPSFDCATRPNPGACVSRTDPRPFAALAEGLIGLCRSLWRGGRHRGGGPVGWGGDGRTVPLTKRGAAP